MVDLAVPESRIADPSVDELERRTRRDVEYEGHLVVRLGDAHTDTNIRLHLARPWGVLEHLEQTCPSVPGLYATPREAQREIDACISTSYRLRELARDAELRRAVDAD